jgi:hypothetical protein
MRETIAIIGSHPGTRAEFDFNRSDADVWVFNEALKSDWCKRADAVFQLHQPVIWRSSTNRNDPKHYEWLQTTSVPVYMLDHFEDVPSSVKYPLDEIIADVFGNNQQIPYFTSSIAYAIALAVYRGYKRIEIYGVEMETQTEYEHQRIGVAYWIGIAVGRGTEINFHSRTMFIEPLYGYEGGTKIEIEHYQARVDELGKLAIDARSDFEKALAQLNGALDKFSKDYNAGLAEIDNQIAACGQQAHRFGQIDGAKQVDERYLKKCQKMLDETGSYTIVKQEYESEAIQSSKDYQAAMLTVFDTAKHMKLAVESMKTKTNRYERRQAVEQFRKVFEAYIKGTTVVGIAMGVGMENKAWMMKLDNLIKALGGEKAYEMVMDEEVKA